MTRRPFMYGRPPLALAAALAVAAHAAAAETAQVRAGEHAAYSRLVIDAPPGADFAWSVSGRTLRVTLGAPVTALDAARAVAALRTLSRVEGVTAQGAALSVALNCDCGARTMRLGDGRIVLDVAAGAPRPAPQPDSAGPSEQRTIADAPEATAAEPVADAAPGPLESGTDSAAGTAPPTGAPAATAVADAPAPEAQTEAATENASPAAPATVAEASAVAEPQPEPAPAEAPAAQADVAARIEAARQALLRQLTAAAEQGLVELADRDKAAPRADAATDDPDAPDPQLRARNALEIARERDPTLPAKEPQRPAHCRDDAEFDVAVWSDGRSFDAQIGAARRALSGEFDRPEPGAAIAYARLLVSYGMGVEARSTIETFDVDHAESAALMEIAQVVEMTAPPADGVLRAGADCPGLHLVWAAAGLALAGEMNPATLDQETLLRELRRLPNSMREIVGTPIGAAALDAGDEKLAQITAQLAQSGRTESAPRDTLLDVLIARLDALRGAHALAEDALMRIARRSTPAGLEAMVRLSELRIARGLAAPHWLAGNMEAMAFTLSQTPEARRLLAAAAMARAHGEGLTSALEALESLSARAGDPQAATRAAHAMLAAFEPDATAQAAYVETVLAYWHLVGDGPDSDAARIAVARRFADAGLENLTEAILAPAAARGLTEARLAAARAAIAAGAPERALTHLEGLDAPDAALIRARTFAALGRFREASLAATQARDTALAARYALRAGDWAAAAAPGGAADLRMLTAMMSDEADLTDEMRAEAEADPALARILAAAEETAAPADPANLLESAQNALEAARRRREIMGDLLTDG